MATIALRALQPRAERENLFNLAIIGIGIDPVTDFITGVKQADDGGILVDEYLQAAEGLFAAGDIAAFTLPLTGERHRIEHWRLACEHGTLAARNMLGQRIPYAGVPFFWSAQKLALYYVGHADVTADELIDGEPGCGPFIAYYSQDGKVIATLGVERNAEMAALQELALINKLPTWQRITPEFNAVNISAECRHLLALRIMISSRASSQPGRPPCGVLRRRHQCPDILRP